MFEQNGLSFFIIISLLIISFLSPCRLFRALEGVPSKGLSSNKSLFFFLHQLYTNCSYLQKTFQTTFGPYCVQFGEKFGVSIEWFSPTSTEADWQRTPIVQQLAKPRLPLFRVCGERGCLCEWGGCRVAMGVDMCMERRSSLCVWLVKNINL